MGAEQTVASLETVNKFYYLQFNLQQKLSKREKNLGDRKCINKSMQGRGDKRMSQENLDKIRQENMLKGNHDEKGVNQGHK